MIIDMGEMKPVKFGLIGTEEIVQNVRIILSTMQGTAPLARNLGLDPTIIDEPIQVAKARLTSEIISVLSEHEPRVIVMEVSFREDHLSGKLVPIVHIEPREGAI